MNNTNFEMAVKIVNRIPNPVPVDRYYRATFGQEGYKWVDGDFDITNTIAPGKKCGPDDFF
jgi:hypothetical protein